jgi:hypothetical protein
MLDALRQLWTDPTTRATILRFLVFLVGVLLKTGTIPTGVEGLGDHVGPLVSGGALLIPAGEKNAKP